MNYPQIAKEIRKKILKMMYESKAAHIGSCLSCVDILTTLYFRILKIDPKNPLAKNRDRFILSKGHAVAALYAVLAKRGFFPKEILDTYYQNGGKLPGHSTLGTVPGIEITTGSLGHGLSMGAGMALAGKRDEKKYRVFVLMSDGECEEGSTWEAALFAHHHKLDNLIGIVDYNKLQAFGKIEDILGLKPLSKKWRDFGWEVKEINGHDFSEIKKVFSKIPFKKGKPSLVIAHTIKGKGVPFMENKMEWHYYNLNKEQYQQALKELG
jgi:transketolase